MLDFQHIQLAHGNGGRFMRELIDEIFAAALANAHLDVTADAARLQLHASNGGGDLGSFMTTDGFTVQPLEFPGGDIGSLAVNGTVNDLAVAGATPKYLTLSAFIEEGLEVAQLKRVVESLSRAALVAGVDIVAGDTKVVPRGQGGGLYLTTTGIGQATAGLDLSMGKIAPSDAVLVSGPVGDHGIAVMLAREDFDLRGDVMSDCAPVLGLTKSLAGLSGLRFMRDPTRGGLATVAHEIAHFRGLQVRLFEDQVPVRPPVRAVCEMLGYDPYYLACEGRVVAVVSDDQAAEALRRWRDQEAGGASAIIGRIEEGAGRAILQTELGGERLLEELEDDPLPRIC